MSRPSNIDRKTLGDRLARREFWGEVFGWTVGIGLLIEYWKEIIDCFVKRKLPPWPLVGGLLVTLGVLGEVWFSRLARETTEEISERADSEVAQANARAEEAIDRAAQAKAAAAEADLARAKIEEQLFKPHILTSAARDEIVEILKEFTGHKRVDIFVFDQHIHEVSQLADSLNTTFTSAGWRSQMWIGDEPRIIGKEVTFNLARECGDSQMQELAKRLSSVLLALNIGSCVSPVGFSIGAPIPALQPLGGWGIRRHKDIGLLRVQVGLRQLTSDPFARPVTPHQA